MGALLRSHREVVPPAILFVSDKITQLLPGLFRHNPIGTAKLQETLPLFDKRIGIERDLALPPLLQHHIPDAKHQRYIPS